MKIPLIFFVLFFSYSVLADEISDFEISGVSVGESLLNYYTEDEIIKRINEVGGDGYNDKYYGIYFNDENKKYDRVSYVIKYSKNDYIKKNNEFIIEGLRGQIFYKDDFSKCLQEKNIAYSNIFKIFDNAEIVNDETRPHFADTSGESIGHNITFKLKGGYIQILCMNWTEEFTKKNGWNDNLSIQITTKKFGDFLDSL